MKTFPVNTFLTHLRPHLSDIVSRWQLVRWGEPFFPGVANSEIRYLTTGVLPDEVPAEILEEKGILSIGVGGGFLDEHASEGTPRKEGECEASLTFKALRLESDVPLGRIIDEVSHCDLTRFVKPSQLSTLVKVRHRKNPTEPAKVLAWTDTAVEALYKSGATQIDKDVYRGVARGILEDLIAEKGWDNERALLHVRELVSQSEGNSGHLLTELAHIFKTLNKRFKRKAPSWLREVLVDMYHDSCDFFKAVDEINLQGTADVSEFSSDSDTFPVITIHSDTEHISQAARSKHCGYCTLVLQRNSRGNTAVFLNVTNEHVQKEGLNLDNLISMIRVREQTRLGHPQSQWDKLAIEGTLRRLRMWYYSKDRDMILNGSVTTPDVKPSRLSLQEILEISQNAFKKDLVWKWWGRYARASEVQRRRGSFRTQIAHDPVRFSLGRMVSHVAVNLLTREEVEQELERIMVP